MEMEMNDSLAVTLDRITAAAGLLEETVARLEAQIAAAEQKLAALEARAELAAPSAEPGAPFMAQSHRDMSGGRKTIPTATATLLAKQGLTLDAQHSVEAGALDAALSSLSLEQRFAVKAQLFRAGLLS